MILALLLGPARRLIGWALTIGVAVLVVFYFQTAVAKPYRIPSSSMEPTLHCSAPVLGCRASQSDRVVAASIVYRFREPHRGEIVVFHAPSMAAKKCGQGGTYVKRIVGIPGDSVVEKRGVVYVNGNRLREPYVVPAERDTLTASWGRIPAKHYFMMGDNRASSCDSRDWGTVARSALIGPVVLTYWPPQRISVH